MERVKRIKDGNCYRFSSYKKKERQKEEAESYWNENCERGGKMKL